jgi:hypothetical protein
MDGLAGLASALAALPHQRISATFFNSAVATLASIGYRRFRLLTTWVVKHAGRRAWDGKWRGGTSAGVGMNRILKEAEDHEQKFRGPKGAD